MPDNPCVRDPPHRDPLHRDPRNRDPRNCLDRGQTVVRSPSYCDRPATLTGMLFLEAIRWEKLALSFWKGLLAILSKPTPEKPPRLDRVLTGCPGQKVDFLMQP